MRSPDVFAALRRFSAAGHTLTILLGNHDIELCYPRVRQAPQNLLGCRRMSVCASFTTARPTLWATLIEHGNRYDGWNAIDYDALRRVCSLKSRGQPFHRRCVFRPQRISQLVAEVMNPVSAAIRSLTLKPENTAALPLLLALEPGRAARLPGL